MTVTINDHLAELLSVDEFNDHLAALLSVAGLEIGCPIWIGVSNFKSTYPIG